MPKRKLYLLLSIALLLVSLVFIITLIVKTDDKYKEENEKYKNINLTAEELHIIKNYEGKEIRYANHIENPIGKSIFDILSNFFNFIPIEVTFSNNNELIESVKSGNVMFAPSVLYTQNRADDLDYSIPTHFQSLYIFSNNATNIYSSLNNQTKAVDTFTVATPVGYIYEDILKETFGDYHFKEFKESNDFDEINTWLDNGTVDAYISNFSSYKEIVNKMPNIKIKSLEGIINPLLASVVSKKDSNTLFINAINKAIKYLDLTSTIKDLTYEYIKNIRIENIRKKKDNYDFLKDEVVLNVSYENVPPYNYYLDNKHQGFYNELLIRICDSLEIKCIQKSPFEENLDEKLHSLVTEQDIDILLGITLSDELKNMVNFATPPAHTRTGVITHISNTEINVSNFYDLFPYSIGVVSHSFDEYFIKDIHPNKTDIKLYESNFELFEAVTKKEVDFAVSSIDILKSYAYGTNFYDIVEVRKIATVKNDSSFAFQNNEQGEILSLFFSEVINTLNYEDLTARYIDFELDSSEYYKNISKFYSNTIKLIIFFVITTISILLFFTLRIIKKSNTDYLSNLGNRNSLSKYLNKIINKDNYTIVYIDLDDFKQINDTLGHDAGDQVIISVANTLKKIPNTKAFRVGGDEFVLVIKSISNNNAIIDNLGTIQVKNTAGVELVKASVGSLNLNHINKPRNVEYVVNLTDFAMMKAKEEGKSRSIYINEKIINKFNLIFRLKNDFFNDLNNGHIVPYAQPIINNKTNQICGYELLSRWTINGKIIPPRVFLKYIKESKKLIALDKYMFEKLCESIRFLKEKGIEIKDKIFSVNFTNYSITNISLKDLNSIVQKYGLKNSDITIEVSEQAYLNENEYNKINMVSNAGFNIAIDDFTASNASLQYITSLDASILKIDQRLLKGLTKTLTNFSKEDMVKIIRKTKIYKNIVYLAKDLNFSIISEGVENEEEKIIVESFNVDTSQGYYYSKPIPFEQLFSILHKKF